MKLFVFEFICAGGMGADPPPSLRDEGGAMLSALVEDFDRVEGIETLTLIQESWKMSLGRSCRCIGPGEEQAGFREMAAQADMVLVIAPEFGGFLAARSRWSLDAGKPLLGCKIPSIDLTSDKWALAKHLLKHAVPIPLTTLLMEDRPPSICAFPAICKPRHGAGSQATFLVRDEEELNHLWAQGRALLPDADFVVQPLIPGQAASVAFLVGPRQRVALAPAAQCLSADGRFRYLGGRLPLPDPLAQRAVRLGQRAIAVVAGLAGWVGVDLVLGEPVDGSQDWVIEINPRLTTSYIGLRRLALDNLAEAWLRIARGKSIAPLRWRRGQIRFSAQRS